MGKFKNDKDIAKFLIKLKRVHLKCKLCDYQSTNKQYLKLHMMQHNNIYPYKCKLCKYKTVRKYDLERHSIRHYEGPKVNCELCNYKTKHPFYLDNHIKKNH
jgi:KRAB domain-containing zinc finger protein